jgi:ATP-dependent RNA helicase RhlE
MDPKIRNLFLLLFLLAFIATIVIYFSTDKVKSNKQDSNNTTPGKSTNKRLVKKKDLNRSDISAAETGNKGISAEVKSGKGKDTGSRKMKAVAKKQDSAKVKNESVKQQEKTAKKKWWSWWPFGSK